MLEKYKNGQPIVYKLLKKMIQKDKIGHAYIIQSSNAYHSRNFAVELAKTLICPQNKLEKINCGNCNICDRIDNENYQEIKKITADGLWIKKEQIQNLQAEFSLKPLEGKRKIYIIYDAEKMNNFAANSMLKFLEEPEEHVIAILVTTDINRILKTVISRCQLINLQQSNVDDTNNLFEVGPNETMVKLAFMQYQREEDIRDFLLNQRNLNKVEAAIKFIKKYEEEKLDLLLSTKSVWHDTFKTKEDVLFAFEVIIYFYRDVLNYMNRGQIEIYNSYEKEVKAFSKNSTNDRIVQMIRKILEMKELVKGNVNLNLVIDKMIIDMKDGVVI
jgi:DNA polymerase III subunit delta'